MPYVIRWGIKSSFREYIGSIEGAEEHVSDGASRLPDGTFVFPAADPAATMDSPELIRCRGAAGFRAHDGLLDVALNEPWIEGSDGDLRLSIRRSGTTSGLRVELARLARVEDMQSDTRWVFDAVLAIGGVHVFDGVYPLGAELDRLVVERLSEEEEAK
ncbi:HtaA domain-containing protein [Agrococcus baldri]|uniref:Htaa domain-containing protein n=1 Tax=Agrococcus baldri TaxID=153730 RepID=A0AA87RGF4_9MICO|nr:HtaA domain-containing protein [Agrococcus baldri]GEK79148.1 hypothetical protein ABA31_04990 [Agrococcus baldri]